MTRSMIAAVAALSVTACSPISALTGGPAADSRNQAFKALGEHVDKCDRHYQGGFGFGASFTFNIDCKAQAEPKP